jgi:hypothetical protein
MPKDLWRKARDRDGARRAKQLATENLCTFEAHAEEVRREKALDARVYWVKLSNSLDLDYTDEVSGDLPELTEEIMAKMIANMIANGIEF